MSSLLFTLSAFGERKRARHEWHIDGEVGESVAPGKISGGKRALESVEPVSVRRTGAVGELIASGGGGSGMLVEQMGHLSLRVRGRVSGRECCLFGLGGAGKGGVGGAGVERWSAGGRMSFEPPIFLLRGFGMKGSLCQGETQRPQETLGITGSLYRQLRHCSVSSRSVIEAVALESYLEA